MAIGLPGRAYDMITSHTTFSPIQIFCAGQHTLTHTRCKTYIDGHDQPDRYQEEASNGNRKDISPSWKLCVVLTHGDESQRDHDGTKDTVPPEWNLGVLVVHSDMNIWRLSAGAADPLPQIATMIESSMYDQCDSRGKAETVLHSECDGEEDRRVRLVFGLVESKVRRQDASHIVLSARVVIAVRVGHGHVPGVPGAGVVES